MTTYDPDGNRIAVHVDLDRAMRAQASPDPLNRLRSVVEVFADYPADHIAITTAAVLDGRTTGLSHGDLRALLAIVDGA